MDNNETETISCSLPEFRDQVRDYDRLALLIIGEHDPESPEGKEYREAALTFAENISLSELRLATVVMVAEGNCKKIVSDYLKVKRAPAVVVLEHGVKRGEVPISGDFDKDVARLKELCR